MAAGPKPHSFAHSTPPSAFQPSLSPIDPPATPALSAPVSASRHSVNTLSARLCHDERCGGRGHARRKSAPRPCHPSARFSTVLLRSILRPFLSPTLIEKSTLSISTADRSRTCVDPFHFRYWYLQRARTCPSTDYVTHVRPSCH